MSQPLFRQEAVVEQRTQWLGTILLAPSISHKLFALFAITAAAAFVGFLFYGDYNRKERIQGWLVPDQGLIRIFTPQASVIKELKGAMLKDVVRVADQIGLATRPMRLELGELPMVKTPCILHWGLNHFLVLKSVGRNSAVIHDTAVGLRRLSMIELSKHFTGMALEATPTGDFARAEAPRVRLRQMLDRFTGLKRSFLQLLMPALAIEVFAIASPLFMQWGVDQALISADCDLLLTLVIGFALLLLIRTSVSTMRSWMLMTLGASIKVQARTNLFSHLVTLPASFFEARHLGDVMSRFSSQSTILKAITTELIKVVLDGLMVGLTLMIMFLYAPVLALLVVAGAFLYSLLRWAFYAPHRQASAETIIWGAKRDSHFLDEATSHLDIQRGNAVSEAIRTTSTTRVIVAHRPETIRSADRVITLNKGRIAHELQVLKEAHLVEGRPRGQFPSAT